MLTAWCGAWPSLAAQLAHRPPGLNLRRLEGEPGIIEVLSAPEGYAELVIGRFHIDALRIS